MSVLAMLLCFSIKWMLETWANLTMDELYITLRHRWKERIRI